MRLSFRLFRSEFPIAARPLRSRKYNNRHAERVTAYKNEPGLAAGSVYLIV